MRIVTLVMAFCLLGGGQLLRLLAPSQDAATLVVLDGVSIGLARAAVLPHSGRVDSDQGAAATADHGDDCDDDHGDDCDDDCDDGCGCPGPCAPLCGQCHSATTAHVTLRALATVRRAWSPPSRPTLAPEGWSFVPVAPLADGVFHPPRV